jgi:hypothetical protein
MDANRYSESDNEENSNNDELSGEDEDSGAELSKSIIAQLDNISAAHKEVTMKARNLITGGAHTQPEQLQDEAESPEDEDIGFDWDEVPGCLSKDGDTSSAGIPADSESTRASRKNSDAARSSPERAPKRSYKKGPAKSPPKLDEYGLRVREKMTLNRKGIQIVSRAWKKWQKDRQDKKDGKVLKTKTSEEIEQGFTIGVAEPFPEPNSYAYEFDELIATDDPYYRKGCERRMVFASDIVPDHFQYGQPGGYKDEPGDGEYKTALDKLSDWALIRPRSTSQDVAGYQDFKTPRHFVLQMGPPNGRYGQPSELAGHLNNVVNLYFRNKLSKSHITIETDIPYHHLAAKGYYKEYMSTLIELMEPKTKLGQRLTIKLSEKICAQWMTTSPAEFYPHPTDITAEWKKIMNTTHAETFKHTVLVQYGRTGLDLKNSFRMPDAEDLKVAEEKHYQQQLRKMEHEKAQVNSALNDIQDFINAVQHHEMMKDPVYAAKVREEAAAAELQKQTADAEEAARLVAFEKILKEKMDATYRRTATSKTQGNSTKVSRPKSAAKSAFEKNNQSAGYKLLQPCSILPKQAQPLPCPPIPSLPEDIIVYTAEDNTDPSVDPGLLDGYDQGSQQSSSLRAPCPFPAHQLGQIETDVPDSEPAPPVLRPSESPTQTEQPSWVPGPPYFRTPTTPQQQLQPEPYTYSSLSSPWQVPELSAPASALHAFSTQPQSQPTQVAGPSSYPRQRQSLPAQRRLAPRPPQHTYMYQPPAVAPINRVQQSRPQPQLQLPTAPAGFSPFTNAFPAPPQRPTAHTQAELDWFAMHQSRLEAKARRKVEIAKEKREKEERMRQREVDSEEKKRFRKTSSSRSQRTETQSTPREPQASQTNRIASSSSLLAQYNPYEMVDPDQAHPQGPAPGPPGNHGFSRHRGTDNPQYQQATQHGRQSNLGEIDLRHIPHTPRRSSSQNTMGAVPGSGLIPSPIAGLAFTQPDSTSQGKRKRDDDEEEDDDAKRGKK